MFGPSPGGHQRRSARALAVSVRLLTLAGPRELTHASLDLLATPEPSARKGLRRLALARTSAVSNVILPMMAGLSTNAFFIDRIYAKTGVVRIPNVSQIAHNSNMVGCDAVALVVVRIVEAQPLAA